MPRQLTIIAAFITALLSITSHAAIYQCQDKQGRTSYSDEPCAEQTETVRQVIPEINVAPFEDRINPPPEPQKTLYRGSNVGRKTRFVRVSIYEETETYMIFEVHGYYNGPSNGRAEFRVMPNIHWSARSFSSSTQGLSKGYARIELSNDNDDIESSDIITLQVWQYTPGKSPRVVETQTLPYKKVWLKKE